MVCMHDITSIFFIFGISEICVMFSQNFWVVSCPVNFFNDAFTTENSGFAVCHRHSAKPTKHSAKALPSVTLGKQHTTSTVPANVSLPSVFYRALGKYFAETVTARLLSVPDQTLGKPVFFAECQIQGTRQTCLLC